MGQTAGSRVSDSEKAHDLLEADLAQGWKLIRRLEQAAGAAPRLQEEEREEAPDGERIDDILSKRGAYAKQLLARLIEDREAMHDLVTACWQRLAKQSQSLCTSQPLRTPNDLNLKLESLLDVYETLGGEYVELATGASSQEEVVEGKDWHQRTARLEESLSRLKSENGQLQADATLAKSELSTLESDLKTQTQSNAALEASATELTEKVTELQDDLSVKRELLVHRKEELATLKTNNMKLVAEVQHLRTLQSQSDLASDMKKLTSEREALVLQVSALEADLAARQLLQTANGKKVEQLEAALKASEERTVGPGDIDVRMHSMQSTLRELYHSIDDDGSENGEEDS